MFFVVPKCVLRLFFLLAISLSSAVKIVAQKITDFSASPTSGCSPLLVNFKDLSANNPTEWKWDLGNGAISSLQNPSATYFAPGQYKVKLIVTNKDGEDSIEKDQFITVQQSPNVNFISNITSGCLPLIIQFTDKSSPGSGTITSWNWDFGDGSIDSIQNPAHTYIASGSHDVTLQVTNNFGCSGTLVQSKFVDIPVTVKARFINDIQNSCHIPVTFTFKNLSSGPDSINYQWNFGDGSTATGVNPSHGYAAVGNYTVSLIASSDKGCSDTIENMIEVTTAKADFIPVEACPAKEVIFTNTSTQPPVNATWDFGDGTMSDSISPTKTYNISGNYTVKMFADFGSCFDSVSKVVTVLPKPSFTADIVTSCKIPVTVNFTSNITPGSKCKWIFGDGSISTDANPSHIYKSNGTFDVTLISGCQDSVKKIKYIKIQAPVIKLLDLPIRDCLPFQHTFSAKITSSEPIMSYSWDFGDSTSASGPTPAHTYTIPGSYTVTLNITTQSGCVSSSKVIDGVKVGNKPKANFAAYPLITCAKYPVNFIDSSTGNVDQWYWTFGDGDTSVLQNPSHIYKDTGTFTVTLIARSNGCPDVISFADYVHIKPPLARFAVIDNCDTPRLKSFYDASRGGDTWDWDFGDNTTSNMQNPTHIYKDTGKYTVSLTVTNLVTHCDHTFMKTVDVIDEDAQFTSVDTSVCKGALVGFQTGKLDLNKVNNYNWNFGDGGIFNYKPDSVPKDFKFYHKYLKSGFFSVRLIIRNKIGCNDTLYRPSYIKVTGPAVKFGSSKPGACVNNSINFLDSSISDGIHPIVQWVWSYGDGAVQTYKNPGFSHTYTQSGTYTVKLKVFDSNGCVDSLGKSKYITISNPTADFISSSNISCPLDSIKFTNQSKGSKLSYLWNFGDGAISKVAEPIHSYTDTGTFSVSLKIGDQYGCETTLKKINYINITYPTADFYMSDSLSTCPPFFVSFKDSSKNYVSLLWDFGDGNSSVLNNPIHSYYYPGTYTIKLTAIGAGGCLGYKTRQIVIKGPEGHFSFSNPQGCNPLQTTFRATTKNNSSFIWDFNDGVTVETPDSIISHSYTDAGIYLPKMILVDVNGCKVPIRGLDTIIVYDVTANISSSSLVLCDSGHVQFTDSSFSNDLVTGYHWDFGDGITSVEQNPVHTYASQGKYLTTLVVTTQFGCKDTATTTNAVRVISSPQIGIAGGEGGCIPATVTLQGQLQKADTSSLSWSWTFGNGNISLQQNPPPQTYATAGDYTAALTATNSSGCKDTATKVIKAYPLPQLQVTADTGLCKGQSVPLSVSGAQDYSWTPSEGLSCSNCATPVASPANTIQYNVRGASENGCLNKDSVIVTVQQPFSMTASRGEDICAGRSVQLSADGAQKYVWTPTAGLDNPTSNRPIATPKETTNYQVVGSDNKGCFRDTAHVPVKVFPVPTVEAGTDTTINVGTSADLVPRMSPDVTDVNWSPTSGVFRNDYPGIVVRPVESTEYTVEVSNAAGCRARDKVTVYVICNNANVFIPNTFSPNGDGANDIFYPRGSGLFSIKMLRIYNRWGQVVFERGNIAPNDESQGWDGTFKGQKLPPDVFVYTMDIVCQNNGILTFKGNVALVR